MSAHRRPANRGEAPQRRRSARDRGRRHTTPAAHRLLPVLLGITVLVIGGVIGPSVVDGRWGSGAKDRERITYASLPDDDPGRGLVYDGLVPAGKDSLCAGTYELDAETCTHGPDPAPAGLEVGNDVTPVTGKVPEPAEPRREAASVPPDAEIVRDEGGTSLAPGAPALIPDAAPGQADFVMGAHDVACEGDGRTGNRIQALYLHEFGTPSRYSGYLGSIRNWAAGVDQIFDASAAETGGSRHIRYVTTPQCRVDVAEVQLPEGALASFTSTIAALQTLGYDRNDRKYLIFADANVYCGIGTFVADNRPGLGNRNNGGPSYGRVDAGCWSSAVAAIETTHMLGALLRDSPNSTGAGSCTDDHDPLCYPDRSGEQLRPVCPKKQEIRLDCGHDDYFSTDPRPDSYLAKNWNVAQSEFLLRSDGGDEPPGAPNAAGASATAPPGATSPTPGATGGGEANGGTTGNGKTGGGTTGNGGTNGGTTGNGKTGGGTTGNGGTNGGTTGAGKAANDGATGNGRTGGGTTGGGEADGGGDAPGGPAGPPAGGPVTEPVAHAAGQAGRQAAVQAVLEVRESTSTSVRLIWSEAAPRSEYEVDVDGKTIARTTATRARLIGLRPDRKYQVTIRSTAGYAARALAQSAPAGRPAANSWFVLKNSLTGGAADLYAARTANGTPLTLGSADGGSQQQWKLVPAGNDSFSLQSRATGKCVVPLGGNPVAGAPLVQGDCAAAGSERWKLFATDHGFSLRTSGGDLTAGVGEQRFGTARLLVLQRPEQARHQSWTAVPG
ncbi:RICIN domain-containing protein [Couchioplanes caeruleus]|uniref:Ricin-type beta-trefoil lectin protein n=2 Tax=Couchioplanes caeruleus TaxID=56438 RepID=A0A3N1GSM6_9ACTN|nr:RICIN domain-containing protein [Couchioplanes caeruleus]ROP33229.1 ricin-type beta-trefoil lectin protein [Couchioplanes caeruleus]